MIKHIPSSQHDFPKVYDQLQPNKPLTCKMEQLSEKTDSTEPRGTHCLERQK